MEIELTADQCDTLLQVEKDTVSDTLRLEILEQLRSKGLLMSHSKYTPLGKSVVAELMTQSSRSRLDASGSTAAYSMIVRIDTTAC